MGKTLIVMLIFLSQCGVAIAIPKGNAVLERTIGELLLSHDQKLSYKNGPVAFSVQIVSNDFFEAYDSRIKGLPVEDRVNFLWFAMWHLDFDGHLMMQFEELVVEDCAEQFISRLEKYIKTESKLQHDKDRLHLSKMVLVGIKQIKDIKSKRKK